MVHKTTRFYDERLSAPRPTHKMGDHPLSAVRDFLFNIFAVTLQIGGRSSVRNLRAGHGVLTGTSLSWKRSVLKGINTNEAVINTFKAYLSRDAPTILTFNNCTLCPHYIYVFCIYLRTNSDLCLLQYKLVGFHNRDEKCLQRGTDWAFK